MSRRLSDPLAAIRIPVQHVDFEPSNTATEVIGTPKEVVDLEKEKSEVVIASSVSAPKIAQVRVKKTIRVSWGSTMLLLTEGMVLRADHYEDGAFERLRKCGVEFEDA